MSNSNKTILAILVVTALLIVVMFMPRSPLVLVRAVTQCQDGTEVVRRVEDMKKPLPESCIPVDENGNVIED